jgi:hypothetical protein
MGKNKFSSPEICSTTLINYSLLSKMDVGGLLQTLYKVALNPPTLFSNWRKSHIITKESCIPCNNAFFFSKSCFYFRV